MVEHGPGSGSGAPTTGARSAAGATASKRQTGVWDAVATYRSTEVWVQHVSGVSRAWPSGAASASTPRHCRSTKGYSWLRASAVCVSLTVPPVGCAPDHDTWISWRPRRFCVCETSSVTSLRAASVSLPFSSTNTRVAITDLDTLPSSCAPAGDEVAERPTATTEARKAVA